MELAFELNPIFDVPAKIVARRRAVFKSRAKSPLAAPYSDVGVIVSKGCGSCGKMHGYSMLECIQGSVPAPTVERVKQPELNPGTVLKDINARYTEPEQSTVHIPPGTVRNLDVGTVPAIGTVHKNRKWEQSHLKSVGETQMNSCIGH